MRFSYLTEQNSIQQVFFLKRIKSAFCHSFSQRDKVKVKGGNSSLAHHQTVADANAGATEGGGCGVKEPESDVFTGNVDARLYSRASLQRAVKVYRFSGTSRFQMYLFFLLF